MNDDDATKIESALECLQDTLTTYKCYKVLKAREPQDKVNLSEYRLITMRALVKAHRLLTEVLES